MSSNPRARSRIDRCVLAALLAWLAGCLELRQDADERGLNPCTSCHGSGDRELPELVQSAPPRDLMGNASAEYPGVGAHAAHLLPSETHGAVACSECHSVPDSTRAPGHVDSAPPAEIQFGQLALLGARVPAYDPGTRRCADTYCHGAQSPRWTETLIGDDACSSCHSMPPAAPHPQSDACSACHSSVIDRDRLFTQPERHVDGNIDVAPAPCDSCHGSDPNGAPPPSVAGALAVTERGVGAHAAHLAGGQGSRPVPCGECHDSPEQLSTASHPEGGAALVVFSGVASAHGAAAHYDAAAGSCQGGWCHGPSAPAESEPLSWTRGGPLDCSDCHGMPPPPPHVQVARCDLCHAEVVRADEIVEPGLHVNGSVDVSVPEDCSACHGDASSAPPPDVSGNVTSAFPGVGAHQAHITPSGPMRAVPCGECHLLPSEVLSPGHMDSLLPAEVVFSGVATAFEANPSYSSGSCSATFCHGGSFVGGRPSGGTDTQPSWIVSESSAPLACDSCHGMPPPPPHPADAACATCHRNIEANQSFNTPEAHVDGIVTFFLP